MKLVSTSPLPTLQAERVRLRALGEGDVEALFGIFGDPQVTRYWSAPPLADRGAAERLLAEIHAGHARSALHQWGIALASEDRVIGTCTLCALDEVNRRGEVGFALARAAWGRGYAREGLETLLGYAFGELELHRIEADVDPDNAASIQLLERLGFRSEGLLRERWLVSGEPRDSLYFGLLRTEWEARGA